MVPHGSSCAAGRCVTGTGDDLSIHTEVQIMMLLQRRVDVDQLSFQLHTSFGQPRHRFLEHKCASVGCFEGRQPQRDSWAQASTGIPFPRARPSEYREESRREEPERTRQQRPAIGSVEAWLGSVYSSGVQWSWPVPIWQEKTRILPVPNSVSWDFLLECEIPSTAATKDSRFREKSHFATTTQYTASWGARFLFILRPNIIRKT